ncbi:MAG: hypothetical protein Q8L48_23670 [Archangium sp.]|nr:hypothetical protein [Archangium sp.]
MSTPGGIGVYLESGAAPANVKDRAWRGVYHHWDGQPDGLGEELLARVLRFKGNLPQVVKQVIDAAPRGWSSLLNNEKTDGLPVSPKDTGNTCYVYLFDVGARRLDVFATHSEAEGERCGSVTFAADGAMSAGRLLEREPPPKWLRAPVDPGWGGSSDADVSVRADVARRVERDATEAGLTTLGFIELMTHAVTETFFAATWPEGTGPLRHLLFRGAWGVNVFWRVRLGEVIVDYPTPSERADLVSRPDGGELVTLHDERGGSVQVDVRRAVVTLPLGARATVLSNILLSALPSAQWLYAFFDLARATQIPDSLAVKVPAAASQAPWSVFHHPDGRRWAIRAGGTGYLLRLGDPSDDPVIKERPTKTAAREICALIAEQVSDGFVQQPDEPA